MRDPEGRQRPSRLSAKAVAVACAALVAAFAATAVAAMGASDRAPRADAAAGPQATAAQDAHDAPRVVIETPWMVPMPVTSFSFGVGVSAPSGATTGTVRPAFRAVTLHRPHDQLSLRLVNAAASGEVLEKVELRKLSIQGSSLIRLRLEQVRVADVETVIGQDGGTDVVRLTFGTFRETYLPGAIESHGSAEACWHVEHHRGC
jgi:type VI protein secretion system component Hcp